MGHGGAVLHGGCWGSAAQIVMQAAAPWANANFHSGGFRKRPSRQPLRAHRNIEPGGCALSNANFQLHLGLQAELRFAKHQPSQRNLAIW
jgi:hypothetical protein